MAYSGRARPISYAIPEQAIGASPQQVLQGRRTQWLNFAKQYKRNLIKYDKLAENETRLLILKRCERKDDPVEIRLIEHVNFSEMGQYEALSYHWGSESSETPIFFLEDQADDDEQAARAQIEKYLIAQLAVPEASRDPTILGMMIAHHHYFPKKNLYEALTQLRSTKKDIKIWVDAICINQTDNEERSIQVQRMSDIYSGASTVLVWLGSADERKDNAMEFVELLLSKPEEITDYVNGEIYTESWQNLLHLMRSTWFSRRWIIQELALARDAVVLCGSKEIHWSSLQDAICIFTDNFDLIRDKFNFKDLNALGEIEPLHAKKLVDTITGIFRRHPHTPEERLQPLLGLEYLVSGLATMDAADPRDTINAFRNISKETYRQRGKGPDKDGYTVDLLTVYVSFVKWVVAETGCLDIICRRWAIPEKSERGSADAYPELVSLPSWIQIVDANDRDNRVIGQRKHGDTFVGLPGQRAYRACHDLVAEVTFGLDGPTSQVTRAAPNVIITSALANEYTIPEHATRPTQAPPENTDSIPSQESGDSQPAQRNGGAEDERLVHEIEQARDVVNTWTAMSTHTRLAKRRGSPLLLPEGLIRGRMGRRVSVTSSNPGSPTSIHLPVLHGGPVIQQFIDRNIDASLYTKGIVIGEVSPLCLMTDGVVGHVVFFQLYGNQRIERGKEVPDVVWRTLVAERGPDNTVPPALYARACQYAMTYLNPNNDLNVKQLREQPPADFIKPFLKRVEAVIWNRCFFKVSDRGKTYMGFGPYTARPGDLLCILHGCNVPCILRRYESARIQRYHSLVGEAYVYGIMDGDFIESLGSQHIQSRTEEFRIL